MRVYSIFKSFDGEVNCKHQGCPTVFIRLAGCNLRCKWCDTVYAQKKTSGKKMSVEDIVETIGESFPDIGKATITGGEPLYQMEETMDLVEQLAFDLGLDVSVETNGSILIPESSVLSGPDCWVMDYKLPSSGQHKKMAEENFNRLDRQDWVKFVIADRGDYEYALKVEQEWGGFILCDFNIAFSPVLKDKMNPKILAEWMLEDNVQAVFNLQIHKFIWPIVGKGEEH